jgi:hypothetical protein
VVSQKVIPQSETENWVCHNFLEDSLEDIPFLMGKMMKKMDAGSRDDTMMIPWSGQEGDSNISL